MRFKQTNPKPVFHCHCRKCGKDLQSDREPIFADLDGTAFQDWYCETCKNLLAGISSLKKTLTYVKWSK